ncbi:acid resistance serine protease MarP [Mycolicibacterium confluentis]|uniref:Acid resistance periplasmic serine protease MarP n=1 Tax=Mycolicibacterium confluentis TaxID=28047 RepID=A0A7I7Y7L9_9MYCO|nr:acid resistance serine protease MarP [Mycolicibacterium confluentis]MCV7319276.1 acid resistance serine protease MarP [Mycolicibacterium confluentis]ORV33536.1 serine protease [Mycolicibacterium confluentis]BBZ36891.1 acid resistance periplasmic serine protease MarP [Mycolicibacterium confluentis]
MTTSQWIDIAIVALAFVFAVSGWRSGALGSVMSLIGVALGGGAGLLLAPHLIDKIDGQRTKLFVALFLILALVVIGEIAGVVLGRAMRGVIRGSGLRFLDSLVGAVVQMLLVVVAAWMLGSPLTTSGQPNLAAAVQGSKVISEVEAVAPEWLRAFPKRLSEVWDTSNLHEALGPLGPTAIAAVDPPDASLATSPIVETVRPSVVKIRGMAEGCQKVLEGTGFVVAPNRVMSNAHVVAGSDSVTIDSDGTEYSATVISYDPDADISILEVPDLPAPPLPFVTDQAVSGTDVLVLGYPGGGDFAATPGRIREVIELNGPDIYHTKTVTREVYTIRGTVRQGNSGGPLINRAGQVLGVIFGAAVDDNDTGFVLTANEVSKQFPKINNTGRAPTGACVGG